MHFDIISSKVLECHSEVRKLMPKVEQKVSDMKKMSEKLITMQRQRQHDMWYLVRIVVCTWCLYKICRLYILPLCQHHKSVGTP